MHKYIMRAASAATATTNAVATATHLPTNFIANEQCDGKWKSEIRVILCFRHCLRHAVFAKCTNASNSLRIFQFSSFYLDGF